MIDPVGGLYYWAIASVPMAPVLVGGRCYSRRTPREGSHGAEVEIGDVTVDAVDLNAEGPWRRPRDFFPAYDEATFAPPRSIEPEVFDPVSGMMFITYQTS